MARATATTVRAILPADHSLSDPQIKAAITPASCVVDRLADGSDLSVDCLTQVEIYLTAHFCAVTDISLSVSFEMEPHMNTSMTRGWKFGEGLMGTPFGQMANTISGGALVDMDRQPVSLFALGCH